MTQTNPSPSRRPTIADQVSAALRRAILTGEYGPGDALPPERELAGRMGTNRNTLREAVRTLEEAGLVAARQGQGVRVLDFRREGRLHLLPAFLAEPGLPLAERAAALGDALRLRTLVLGELAALSALRRDANDVARLRELAGGAGDALAAAALALDLEFYRALALAARSRVGSWAYNTFAPAIAALLDARPELWVTPPDYASTLAEVVAAVAGRLPEPARKAVHRHLAASDQAVIAALATTVHGAIA